MTFLGAFLVAVVVAALKGDYADNGLVAGIVTLGTVIGIGSWTVRSCLSIRRMEEEFVESLRYVMRRVS
jgi:hypothetical protein